MTQKAIGFVPTQADVERVKRGAVVAWNLWETDKDRAALVRWFDYCEWLVEWQV